MFFWNYIFQSYHINKLYLMFIIYYMSCGMCLHFYLFAKILAEDRTCKHYSSPINCLGKGTRQLKKSNILHVVRSQIYARVIQERQAEC